MKDKRESERKTKEWKIKERVKDKRESERKEAKRKRKEAKIWRKKIEWKKYWYVVQEFLKNYVNLSNIRNNFLLF